jgi:hypothetical protein
MPILPAIGIITTMSFTEFIVNMRNLNTEFDKLEIGGMGDFKVQLF